MTNIQERLQVLFELLGLVGPHRKIVNAHDINRLTAVQNFHAKESQRAAPPDANFHERPGVEALDHVGVEFFVVEPAADGLKKVRNHDAATSLKKFTHGSKQFGSPQFQLAVTYSCPAPPICCRNSSLSISVARIAYHSFALPAKNPVRPLSITLSYVRTGDATTGTPIACPSSTLSCDRDQLNGMSCNGASQMSGSIARSCPRYLSVVM